MDGESSLEKQIFKQIFSKKNLALRVIAELQMAWQGRTHIGQDLQVYHFYISAFLPFLTQQWAMRPLTRTRGEDPY